MKKTDFGDILNKWENSSSSRQGQTMDQWLKDNKIIDKDSAAGRGGSPGEKRRHLHHKKPDAVLDIHGLTSEQAWTSLDVFLANARENNYEKIRIIHGKGIHTNGTPALELTVRKFLEKCSYAGESGFEKSSNGGSGATWVLIKNPDPS